MVFFGHVLFRSAARGCAVYLDDELQARLEDLAQAKGVDFSDLVNNLLRKDLELIETAM